MGVINKTAWIDFPIKYRNLIKFNTDGNVVQQTIIFYDEDGHDEHSEDIPVGNPVMLGINWDHRVTWLSFDLNSLRWGLEEDDYLNNYEYVLYFKADGENGATKYVVTDFDAHEPILNFYVPAKITKNATNYQILLSIIHKDSAESHNIDPEDATEVFVSDVFNGFVAASIFDPAAIHWNEWHDNTYQLNAVTKAPVHCILADDGAFRVWKGEQTVSNAIIGNKKDNYVTYLAFNNSDISTKLTYVSTTQGRKSFTIFLAFRGKVNGELYASRLEKLTGAEGQDEEYNYIAWIPSSISNNFDMYDCIMVAYYSKFVVVNDDDQVDKDTIERAFEKFTPSGDDVISNLTITDAYKSEEANGFYLTDEDDVEYRETSEDYYFFVSDFIILNVKDNFLMNSPAENINALGYGSGLNTSGQSNFEDADGMIFSGADEGVIFSNEE